MNSPQSLYILCFATLLAITCVPATAAERRVPQDFKTIQAAVNAARPGDTVLVSPGVYKERIRLMQSVVLKSAGGDARGKIGLKRAEATVIDGGGNAGKGPGIVMAEGATLDGFTVTNVGLYDDAEWKKHHATHGELLPDKQGAVGTGTGFPAVAVVGVNCTIRSNIVHHNGHAGIGIRGAKGKRISPHVYGNIAYRNMGGGIASADESSAIIEENRCFQNLRAGIGSRNASPLILHNICYENIRAGIGNREGAKPILRGNKCYRNRRAGIGIRMKGTSPIVDDNECYENDMAGIGNRDGATPLIRNNRCYKNKMAGIGTRDGAAPIICGNHCFKNEMAGIGSRGGAQPVIVGNESRQNQKAGIGVRGKETVAVIVGNKCIENRLVAIGVPDGATAYIHGNKLLRTGGGAPPLVAVKGGSTAVLSHNSISGGGVAGLLVQGDVRAMGNRFQGKGKGQGSAVWVWKKSTVTVCDNRFNGYRNAINASGSNVTATDNIVRDFQGAAIIIRKPTFPARVFANTAISNNPKDKAASIEGTKGTLENLLKPRGKVDDSRDSMSFLSPRPKLPRSPITTRRFRRTVFGHIFGDTLFIRADYDEIKNPPILSRQVYSCTQYDCAFLLPVTFPEKPAHAFRRTHESLPGSLRCCRSRAAGLGCVRKLRD